MTTAAKRQPKVRGIGSYVVTTWANDGTKDAFRMCVHQDAIGVALSYACSPHFTAAEITKDGELLARYENEKATAR